MQTLATEIRSKPGKAGTVASQSRRADLQRRTRITALFDELAGLMAAAKVFPVVLDPDSDLATIDRKLVLIGLATDHAVSRVLSQGSADTHSRVEALVQANSLARLLRLHVRLRTEAAPTADRILALAESDHWRQRCDQGRDSE